MFDEKESDSNDMIVIDLVESHHFQDKYLCFHDLNLLTFMRGDYETRLELLPLMLKSHTPNGVIDILHCVNFLHLASK